MVKVVKIHKDRGYGDGMFEVLSSTDHEVKLQELMPGGLVKLPVISLYKVHIFEDIHTRRKGFELQRGRAEKIGRAR